MRDAWFRRVWAGCGLLLFLATWRLWTAQTEFPQIPFFQTLRDVPAWCDEVALAVVVVSLCVVLLTGNERLWRLAMLSFVVATVGLILLNQHRLQAWTYQFVALALVMGFGSRERAVARMRWIVVSIYLYSAVSKFDFLFLQSLGPEFLSTLIGYFGLSTAAWPADLRFWLSVIFPLSELAVGCGLCFSATRRAAVVAAIVLHLLLLLILSPWGLASQPGVLIWNLFFIAQAVLLFIPEKQTHAISTMPPATQRRPADLISSFVTALVILLPLSAPWDWCDHWPAWELYAPRTSRALVAIHGSAVDRLPPALQDHMSELRDDSDWRQLHMDRWSLATLSAPIYPQDRFQVGVALELAERYDLNRAIFVTRQGTASRWTGVREESTYRSHDQLQTARSRFRLNVQPRRLSVVK